MGDITSFYIFDTNMHVTVRLMTVCSASHEEYFCMLLIGSPNRPDKQNACLLLHTKKLPAQQKF